MKVKVTDKQLTEWFSEVLEGKEVINESSNVTKDDVKSIVKKEIKEFLGMTNTSDINEKVKKMVKEAIKNDKDLEKHMVDISKNVLIQMYKNLWTRRNFWSNDLKNSSN
jgi:Na+/phosphate symporter